MKLLIHCRLVVCALQFTVVCACSSRVIRASRRDGRQVRFDLSRQTARTRLLTPSMGGPFLEIP